MALRIGVGDLDDRRVQALLAEHLAGMHANSPAGRVFALDLTGLRVPEVSFYAAWEGDALAGVGALKALDGKTGEIKSMRTAAKHLRQGVAARLLEFLIAEARRRDYTRVSLETGSGPAFEPALALYRKFGFANGAPFGDYTAGPFNQFLHLDLDR